MAKGHLDAVAGSYHNRLKSERSATELERSGLEQKLEAVQARLHAADCAGDRYHEYCDFPDTELQCPRCWMYCGQKKPLRQIDDPAHGAAYRCSECREEYRFFPGESS
jgi:hypothetical protein